MIKRAPKKIIAENIHNGRLIVGSLSDIGLKSNTFDKIICISVFQYLSNEDCEKALKEFVRISKNSAIFVLHIKNLFSLYLSTLYLAKKIKSVFKKNVKIEYYRSYRWYEKRLSKLGVQIVNYNSHGIFLIDFLPKSLFFWLKRK